MPFPPFLINKPKLGKLDTVICSPPRLSSPPPSAKPRNQSLMDSSAASDKNNSANRDEEIEDEVDDVGSGSPSHEDKLRVKETLMRENMSISGLKVITIPDPTHILPEPKYARVQNGSYIHLLKT
ncbi:unnamed protein product [Thlaspi arvense]|uniref:Uncharacterized protein n=1 Tax=Thlaspi arvense TaxID=13288 RepID=A0AAU9SFS7_THLAR|nr:unnamed protein product [Thlaspi arvense]